MASQILLVDSSQEYHQICNERLAPAAHTLICTFEGLQAAALLQEQRVDLILVDIDTPCRGLDELVQQNNTATAPAPIIGLTQDATDPVMKNNLHNRVQGYLPKAFDVPQMEQCLQKPCTPKQAPLLVIDDIANVACRLTQLILPPFEVESVLETSLALQSCGQQNYRAILIDIDLPNATPQWLESLRAKQPQAQVLAMPKRMPDDNAVRYQQAGFTGMLAKPFLLHEVHAMLGGLLTRQEILSTQENVVSVSDIAATAAALPQADIPIQSYILEFVESAADACFPFVILNIQSLTPNSTSLALLDEVSARCTELALPLRLVASPDFKKDLKKHNPKKAFDMFDSIQAAQDH
jgi:DNA-binding response OmpR family regulator